MCLATARERVARGAALLDAQLPGWAARIVPEDLKMQDGCKCILGQLYGTYGVGKMMLATPAVFYNPARYGFDVANSWEPGLPTTFEHLRQAWVEKIDAWLAAPAVAVPEQPEEELVCA